MNDETAVYIDFWEDLPNSIFAGVRADVELLTTLFMGFSQKVSDIYEIYVVSTYYRWIEMACVT